MLLSNVRGECTGGGGIDVLLDAWGTDNCAKAEAKTSGGPTKATPGQYGDVVANMRAGRARKRSARCSIALDTLRQRQLVVQPFMQFSRQ
jgi:hypothetical protein